MNVVYFNIENDIKIAFFRKIAIILDLRRDKFFFVDDTYSDALRTILTQSFHKVDDYYIPNNPEQSVCQLLNDVIKEFRLMKFIAAEDFSEPRFMYRDAEEGVANLEWRTQCDHNLSIPVLLFLKMFFYLFVTHLTIKIFGIRQLLKICNHVRDKNKKLVDDADRYLNKLASYLTTAAMYFPYKTKCLVWAATLHRVAGLYGIPTQLVIGVQNYPFMSHAWVEYNEKAVCDNPDLNKELAVLLRIPESPP